MDKLAPKVVNNSFAACSWNRQRSNAELTSFINRKLSQLTNVSLVD